MTHSAIRNPKSKIVWVLLIEDNPGDARLIRKMLTKAKVVLFELECANRLSTGLERLAEGGIDLVLLDLSLPDSPGLDTFAKTYAQAPHVPIIVLTGLDDQELAVHAVREGAQDYLVKGEVDSNLLLRAMRYAIERKGAEKVLRQSEERYRRITGAVTDYIFTVRIDNGHPVETVHGPASVAVTGYTPEEFASDPYLWIRMVPEEDHAAVQEQASRILLGQDVQPIEHRILRKDGAIRWVRNTLVPHYDTQGKLLSYDGLIRDINERKEAEEATAKLEAQLHQAQKIKAIGTLAGGIAHDFNNILAAILGYTELTMYDLPEGSLARANLEQALKAGMRAKNLVQQILTFSRKSEQERRPVQIHLIVKEALKLLRSSLPATIEIRQNIDTKCGVVLADPTQIDQVMMNLCTNAYHAMHERGGVLEVSLNVFEIDAAFARTHANLQEGSYVRLTVSDTGHGMDRATMERIFEPFFTTKAVGDGTGMGLATVHGIVTSHDGAITVHSEPEKGSTFHVYFPRLDSILQPEAQTTEPVPRGKERILFVDDEEQLVRMGQQMLERLGYHVTVRTSSVEAVEAFRAQPDRFDLVITDQTMPNMTGVELAKELMRIRPDVPIILTTGFSEVVTPQEAKNAGIREYIMKPVVARDLAQAIRQVLDG